MSTPMVRRVLVLEPVAAAGVSLLREAGLEVFEAADMSEFERNEQLATTHALVVRSGTTVDASLMDRAPELLVIGRAGVGLDNVDMLEATQRGIAVVNTPGGNAIAAAEQTLALTLALARHTAHAHASLAAGEWDRHRYVGIELAGKTLGIVGLGRIGALVAQRAKAFGMSILVTDPFLTDERAEAMGLERIELKPLLRQADIITLHTPLTDGTRGMIDAAALALMKSTALVVNCARGGLIDEDALLEALRGGTIAGAALDVYSAEPPTKSGLIGLPNVVHTPHLGASTREAKENVSVTIALALIALLNEGDYSVAVNLPYASADLKELAPLLDLAERLGRFQGGMLDAAPDRAELEVITDAAQEISPLVQAFLCGLLREACGEEVNLVSAGVKAEQLGLTVSSARHPAQKGYPVQLITRVGSGGRQRVVQGAVLAQGEPRITRVDEYWLDLKPKGDWLVMRNADVPGVMGKVGTLLGELGINIGEMRLGRRESGREAISVWQIDTPLEDDVLQRLMGIEEIERVRRVRLG